MKKKKYDTAVVLLYLLGKEYVLPNAFRKTIPASTISTWRKTDYRTYTGHEFRSVFDQAWDSLEEGHQRRGLQKTLSAITKAWVLFQDPWLATVKKARTDPALQTKIVRCVAYLRNELGLPETLRLLRLSPVLYREWCFRQNKACAASQHKLCLRRYPNQLTPNEYRKMEALLQAPKYDRWPISSIAALALRKNKVAVSLFSWYKRARLMDLSHPPAKAKRKSVGLQATRPNEYLHIDTTFYALADGTKICLTVVMDNYSRMILGYAVKEKLCFELVSSALQNALNTLRLHPDQAGRFLVADGGRENHNKKIDGFIASLPNGALTKVKALKDIQFSNSPIEAIHLILKGRYLRGHKHGSLQTFTLCLEEAVMDYNEKRPHSSHAPRTPSEVYFGIPLKFDPAKRMKKARAARTKTNASSVCLACRTATTIPAKIAPSGVLPAVPI